MGLLLTVGNFNNVEQWEGLFAGYKLLVCRLEMEKVDRGMINERLSEQIRNNVSS